METARQSPLFISLLLDLSAWHLLAESSSLGLLIEGAELEPYRSMCGVTVAHGTSPVNTGSWGLGGGTTDHVRTGDGLGSICTGAPRCLTTKGQYFLSLRSGPSSHLLSYYPSCLAPGCHVTSQLYGCPDVAFQRTGLSEVSRTCLGAEESLPWALTAAQDSVQAVFLGPADISRSS